MPKRQTGLVIKISQQLELVMDLHADAAREERPLRQVGVAPRSQTPDRTHDCMKCRRIAT
eukprot:9708570-Lingulodinium_polyedra.AAC.1